MNLGLQNQVAWICGSTGAIGAAVARTLTDEGVSLALSARDANALDALVAELRPAAPHPPLALKGPLRQISLICDPPTLEADAVDGPGL